MTTRSRIRFVGAAGAAVLGLAAAAVPAAAASTTATTTITGAGAGGLAFLNGSPNGALSFGSVTLTGSDQFPTSPLAFDIGDSTGSGNGYNVTASGTQFTDGAGNFLPANATTVQGAPTDACDASSSCALASGTVLYPYTLTGASTKILNAAASSGMGSQTITPTFRLYVPAATKAGSYSATWTFSLVAGP